MRGYIIISAIISLMVLTRLSQLTWKFENLTSWRPAQPIGQLGATAAERQHSVCGADQVGCGAIGGYVAGSRGMFLRHKVCRKDGKEHRYWSIVENRRVSGGRTVQRHVLYLGEINDSQQAAWCHA